MGEGQANGVGDDSRQRPARRNAPSFRHAVTLVFALLGPGMAGCAHQTVRSRPLAFPAPSPQDSASDTALNSALHAYYREWQGVPYRYGGRDTDGIDCSSFVRQTLGAIESLDLPRTTAAQARLGRAIKRSELAPGDLVFFRTGGSSYHVGIYVGEGRFMHASSSRGVTLSNLNNVYWRRHYWQSRRIAAAD